MDISKLRKGDVVLVRMTVSRTARAPVENEVGTSTVECNFGPEPLSYATHYVDREHIVSVEARRFNAGDWRGGCNAFLAWNRAVGKVVRGLTRRREAERKICLAGVR